MRVVGLCLCVCFFLIVSKSFAVPVSFDFSHSTDDYSYDGDGVSLQVTGYALDASVLRSATITQTNSGIGVSSKEGDDGQLENSGPDDFLQFSFSRQVVLQQVVFSLVDAGDEFVLSVDDLLSSSAAEIWTDSQVPLIDKVCAYDFALSGSLFQFGVSDTSDKFRIKGMTVDVPAPVPTPEPSTWLLLGSGLAGLFCWRRRVAG